MRTAFVNTVCEIMRKDTNVVFLTADMGYSVFEAMQEEFSDRFINTGVTEQSTISVAAGLALSGHTVFVYAQAPFITMRCYEQIRLDVCYNNLDIKIIGSATGFSSNQLGVSHFALEDVGIMKMLPNMKVFTPGDPHESVWATNSAYKTPGPAYIRLTKAGSTVVHKDPIKLDIGKGIKIIDGTDALLLVSGSLLPMAEQIVKVLQDAKIYCGLYSFPIVKPIDLGMLKRIAKDTQYIFTLEEHFVSGGFGSAIVDLFAQSDLRPSIYKFGVPDKFTAVTGSIDYLLEQNGLSQKIISKKIKSLLNKSKQTYS